MKLDTAMAVPVVDARPLLSGDTASTDAALGAALAEAGGCVLVGLPHLGAARSAIFSFFDQPAEAKAAVAGQHQLWGYSGRPRRGWLAIESYNCGPPSLAAHPGTWEHGRREFVPCRRADADVHFLPNVWPAEPVLPGWRAAMEAQHAAFERLGLVCVRSVARWLGADEEAAAAPWADSLSTLRPISYRPPPPGWAPEPGDGIATLDDGRFVQFPEHRDNGTGLSLISSSAAGLQMQSPDGVWRDVPAVEGGVSVHAGKGLELLSGGRLRATPHRVLSSGGGRRSLSFFFCPHPSNQILPLAGRSPAETAALEASAALASRRESHAEGWAVEAAAWPWWSSNSVSGYRAAQPPPKL